MYEAVLNSPFDNVKNCLLYIRVSTNRQLNEGHSFEDQRDRLTKFAHDKKWRILDIYDDGGKSGKSTSGRPEFQRMLERCASDPDVDAVLLEETDRFARNTQDHLAVKAFLKKHKVELITSEQPNFGDDPVGNFVDTILAGANQLQREITGVKTKRTMIALAEKGLQPGPATTGYINSFKKGVPWKVDDEREYYVRQAFSLFLTNTYSVHTISDLLYEEGFRTKGGKRVHSSQIHRMLTDYRYAGKTVYDGKTYDGQHPKIIELSDIKKAEELMQKRNKGADRTRKHNWLLNGLAHCKGCGSLMSGEKHVKPTGHINKYYRCLGPKNRGQKCTEQYPVMDEIHDQLASWISSLQFDERFYLNLRHVLLEIMKSQGTDIGSKIEALKKRRDVIERKMDKLEDQILAETIPAERIEKKYKPLRDELASVEIDIEKYSRPSANLDKQKIEKIVVFMKRLPELYEVFTEPERKQFLKWFTTNIWIRDRKIVEITYTPGFEALIEQDMVRISETWLLG